jgi:uroporphyrinogen-III synthase
MNVVGVPEPFTTAEVIATLEDVPTEHRDATVVHYGERNAAVVDVLVRRGLLVNELTVYEWRLPTDLEPLTTAIDALIAGEIPVLAFTSQIQVRHLLDVAGAKRTALVSALDSRVLVGAVGPTCAAACHDAGIRDVTTPPHPKLLPLLQSLALAWTTRGGSERAGSGPRAANDS